MLEICLSANTFLLQDVGGGRGRHVFGALGHQTSNLNPALTARKGLTT